MASKMLVTFSFTMGLIVYIYKMFELVSISIQDIDKLHTEMHPNHTDNLLMTNNLQKLFYGEDMSDKEGLGSDNIEKFINIDEDADSQLMDGENELNAYGCLKNAIKDHQQVIK